MKLSNYSLNYAALLKSGELDIFGFLVLCRGPGLEGASLGWRVSDTSVLDTSVL